MTTEVTKTIFKTMLGSGGQMLIVDTIEHESELWLVPQWLGAPGQKWQMPRHIVRLTGRQYQTFSPDSQYPADYLLNEPIPKSVLDGQESDGWIVVTGPDLQIVPADKSSSDTPLSH